MAATGWSYFVPYEEDIERALQELRRDVFDKGDYYRPGEEFGQIAGQVEGIMPSTQGLKKMLAISKALDEAMKNLGADTTKAEKDTEDVQKFLERAEASGMAAAMGEAAKDVATRPKPSTIGELLEMNEEAGTHSIIDITHTGDEPGCGVAAPLAEDRLLQLFGTAQPTKPMVEKMCETGELMELRERWQGTYIILYENDAASEILFVGNSGD